MPRFVIRATTRWKLTLELGKGPRRIALAERVRLGLHPYEALGLEVEKIVGDWDAVRMLRKTYPARRRSAGAPRLRRPEGPAGGARGHAPGGSGAAADARDGTRAARRGPRHVRRPSRRRRHLRARHRPRRSRQRRDGSGRRSWRTARTARHPHAARGDDGARQRMGAAARATTATGFDADPARVADPSFAGSGRRGTRRRRLRGDRRRDSCIDASGSRACSAVRRATRRCRRSQVAAYEGLPASADADLRQAIAGNLTCVSPRSSSSRRPRTMRSRRSIRRRRR